MGPKTASPGFRLDLRAELEPLYRFISGRVGGNRSLAEDLSQETLLAALQGGFDPARGRLRPWLFGVALRKIVDHDRGRRLARRHLQQAAGDLAVRMIREPLPEEWLERDEVRTIVNDALARLPEPVAALLLRKYFDGASVSDLSAELGASEKAVESQLTRARAALHEAIERISQRGQEDEP